MPRPLPLALLLLLLLTAILTPGCDDDDDTSILQPTTPTLQAAPDTLWVSDEAPSASVLLSGAPAGAEWRATSSRVWLGAQPSQGTIDDGVQEITITAAATGMNAGVHGGSMNFISARGEDHVWVMFTVGWHPAAEFDRTLITMDAATDSELLFLANTGTGDLHWTLTTEAPWLTITPDAGVIGAGQGTMMAVVVDWSQLAPGDHQATLELGGNAENLPLTVTVEKTVPARAVLAVPDTVTADFTESATEIAVANRGNVDLAWSAESLDGFLSLPTASGTTTPGATTPLAVAIDRAGMTTGTYEGAVVLTAGDQADTVAVHVAHYDDPLWHLDHAVRDAEYSRDHDVIITISGDPARLHRLDPATQTVTSVDLATTPLSVSIAPDGDEAVVGHNALVSQVDLTTMTVTAVHTVGVEAFDIVHGGNGWAYVFPEEDQWCDLMCLELGTGDVTAHTGWSIYENTRGKLHPGGEWIYAANNGLSPSDFEKFDITGGTAQFLYDSPYHGDYSFAGDIWISDHGGRLYARSSNVFRASSDQQQDMTYAGQLDGIGAVRWVDHSTAAGLVFALPAGDWNDDPEPRVFVYDTAYLNPQPGIDLLPFAVPGGPDGVRFFEGWGRYVFADQAGEHLWVVQQAEPAAGLLMDWAVAGFPVDGSGR